MEGFEFDTFNDNTPEMRGEEETDLINDYNNGDLDDDDDYDENIDLEGRPDLNPFDPNAWVKARDVNTTEEENVEENTLKNRLKRWETAEKRRITRTRKTFFQKEFNQEIVMKDGPASKELINKSLISISEKTGKVNGILYDNTRVVVKKGNGFVLSKSEVAKNAVQEYTHLMEKARYEHSKTANGSIEETVGSLPGTSAVNGIRANVIDNIQAEIEIGNNSVDRTQLTDEELRELGGILAVDNIDNLDAVDIAAKYWDNKAKAEVDIRKKAVYKVISDVAKLKAEELRLKNNLKPANEETLDKIAEDDLTKYEKFKKIAKNNLGVLSAVAITIGGIITTVVIAGKKGLTNAAKAVAKVAADLAKTTLKLAKAQFKILQAALPVILKLFNLLTKLLLFGSKGLLWLSKNLWILAIAFAYILYKNVKALLPKNKEKPT